MDPEFCYPLKDPIYYHPKFSPINQAILCFATSCHLCKWSLFWSLTWTACCLCISRSGIHNTYQSHIIYSQAFASYSYVIIASVLYFISSVRVRVCGCTCVEAQGQCCASSIALQIMLWENVSFWTWNSSIQLYWLSREPHESYRLHLVSIEFMGMGSSVLKFLK